MSAVSLSKEKFQVEDHFKPSCFIYLPNEGLQGENIPSHVLWDNMKVESIQVSFRSPLKLKDVFNAECWECHDNNLIVKKVELEGYIGLSFESFKVPDIEVLVPVEFIIRLSDSNVIKKTKEVKLFRPQLKMEIPTKEININPKTGFVKGRIGIKNVGRGTLITYISTTDDSSTKLETPPKYKEFAERFLLDLYEELSALGKEFPKFGGLLDEIISWENKDFLKLSPEERNKYIEFGNKLASLLASDRKLLQGFVEAYAKTLAKNTELIEAIRKVIKVYESLVSKDILLINPFEEAVLTGKKEEIILKILQTDRVFDTYEDITLPKIELKSSEEIRVPIYRLFAWG